MRGTAGFAQSLRQDEAAVAAALDEKWSNGPVEGQVNRLKAIKRQMYGRAGFQLLGVSVRGTADSRRVSVRMKRQWPRLWTRSGAMARWRDR